VAAQSSQQSPVWKVRVPDRINRTDVYAASRPPTSSPRQRKLSRWGEVFWHSAAQHVLASAGGDHSVKLWNLGAPESPRAILAVHGDSIQGFAFNPTRQLPVTTSRARKLRLFDPRGVGEAVRVTEGHGGIKGARVVWMGVLLGDRNRIATTGFSRMSDRQVGV
jgi:coronin-1B/1C/6